MIINLITSLILLYSTCYHWCIFLTWCSFSKFQLFTQWIWHQKLSTGHTCLAQQTRSNDNTSGNFYFNRLMSIMNALPVINYQDNPLSIKAKLLDYLCARKQNQPGFCSSTHVSFSKCYMITLTQFYQWLTC